MKFAQKFSISMAIIASGLMVLPVFAADPPAPGSEAPSSAAPATGNATITSGLACCVILLLVTIVFLI